MVFSKNVPQAVLRYRDLKFTLNQLLFDSRSCPTWKSKPWRRTPLTVLSTVPDTLSITSNMSFMCIRCLIEQKYMNLVFLFNFSNMSIQTKQDPAHEST